MKVIELCHALAVEIESPNLNVDNVPSIGTLLSCCQGLVIIDKEASTVRLVHFTLQEYLRAHGTAHSTMAETCLSYLNSQQVKAISKNHSPDLQGTPFLEYSSMYWGMHAKRDLSDCAKLLALKLFDDYNNHISTRTLLKAQEYPYAINFDEYYLFSGLHCASPFGIVEIVTGLIQVEGCDINEKDCVGNTPLLWAALNGRERVVEMRLKRDDVGPDIPGNNGQTPLLCAAWNGQVEAVKFLLERDEINSNKPDNDGRTSLWGAALNGHVEVLKLLLERDEVNPDEADNDGRTPLHCAAVSGHEGVVKMLLERREVNPDKPAQDDLTPLLGAAFYGDEGVVKMLLERDEVNPDKPYNDGRTPLWCAALNGHVEVVKLLLERVDVNPDEPDNNGQTPLLHAARNSHSGVAKLLLGRDDVNPDKPDNGDRTPLSWAAGGGHSGIVEMLLGTRGVTPDTMDNSGLTPLAWAAEHKHTRVVEMILQRCSPSQDIVMTDPTDQKAPTRRSARVAKRRLADHVSAPQSAGSTPHIDPFPAAPPELSRRRSKRIRRS